MEDDLRFIEIRVGVLGFCGALAGAARAMLKGHLIGRTSALTGMSCAMVATACFGTERIVNIASRKIILENDMKSAQELGLVSHGLGGVLSGSLLGAMYNGKPIQGILFITPLMLLAGYGDSLFYQMRRERQLEEELTR